MKQPEGSSQSNDRLGELISKLAELLPPDNVKASAFISAMKDEVRRKQQQDSERSELIERLEEAYQKLTSPANRVGVFVGFLEPGIATIIHGDQEFVTVIDPCMDHADLKVGSRVKLNEAYAVVGLLPDSDNGSIVKVAQVLDGRRIRITSDSQSMGRIVMLSETIKESVIKNGDEVRIDPSGGIAVEHFAKQVGSDYFIEEVPNTPWSLIGGQQAAVELIRETLEHPLLYPEIYAKFDQRPVKGILLYGPPGCGKTLIGKAVAYNLAKDYSAKLGRPVKECFLHISGPKILNMWLGETERMIREIFDTARQKASEDQIVVIFIDEAESVLRTRSQGRSLNISNTVVPQFCAEMDGIVSLENVVIILTSNRPDYIDPAILRPQRIDRKIRVERPDKDATREILNLYITPSTPIDPEFSESNDGDTCARKALVERTADLLWRESRESEFLVLGLRSGESKTLYWKDLVSGALLKSIVDRAKNKAIRRAIQDPSKSHGLTSDDLALSIKEEYQENEIFPKNEAIDDWTKLLDFGVDAIVSVQAMRTSDNNKRLQGSVI